MSEKNSLVEEAIIQMKNLEDVIAENAKGILASTMKGEISELVKESLKEQDDDDSEEVTVDDLETGDEEEFDVDTDVDADDDFDTDVENDGLVDLDDDSEMSFDDEEVVDMRGATASELQKVFKKMKPEDGIIVTQDNGSITLSDENTDNEYLIKLGESKNKKKSNLNEMKKSGHGEEFSSQDEMFEMDDMGSMDFYGEESDSLNEISDEDLDELIASLGAESSDEDMDDQGEYHNSFNSDDEFMGVEKSMGDMEFEDEDEEEEDEFDEFEESYESDEVSMDDLGETIYEITLDGETDEEWSEEMDEEMDEEDYNEEDEMTNESIGFKAKGQGFGKPTKFNYKKTTGGFKEDKKQGSRGVGMGKGPKFEFKEGATEAPTKAPKVKPGTETERKTGNPMRNPNKKDEPAPAKAKKGETTEAARTLGNGKKWGRNGLDKPRTAPRHLSVESVNAEVDMLKSKNEEYRKALNVFRDKLNEVAVFNSNLAYATRLFTEHSTTKQEKINILRRFDGTETIKESKTLYKVIKDELSNKNESQVVKESVEVRINRTPSTGAVNLIESKTYENPQFLRMKDIMNKLIK
jgi:hypothetical protein